MKPTIAALAAALLTALVPAFALADWDFQENLFGATNVNAQAGNGGLTAGFAETGELTVLGWPSPSYYDQLDYQTSSDEDAREQPYFGADPAEGVFAGIWYETDQNSAMLWLRDAPFQTEQRYLHDGSAVVLTTHQAAGIGLTVTVENLVRIDRDVLVWRYRVQRDEGSPIQRIALVFYENLAPSLRKEAYMPLQDWMFDGDNDFGALFVDESDALLHFAPQQGDLSLLDDWMAYTWPLSLEVAVAQEWKALVEGAGPGVYLAIGGREAPAEYQVGFDDHQPCQQNTGWTYTPTSAFSDAEDGSLRRSPAAGCQATAALLWRHDFDLHPAIAEFEVFLAAGATAEEALDGLTDTRATTFESLVATTDAHFAELLSETELPDGADDETIAFARRWLVSLMQGVDRESAAIVASITTQPPYRQDWPRDSAFFNLALDVAGFHDLVTEHNRFLLSVQETEDHHDFLDQLTPAGAWHMNFYADGEYGGFIPFEIDQVGLMVWSLLNHARFIDSVSERRAYLDDVMEPVVLAADLLSGCVDDAYPYGDGASSPRDTLIAEVRGGTYPNNDEERAALLAAGEYGRFLQCWANEDDHEYTEQTLYGAHTVRLGLVAAAEAIRATCGDEARAAWYDRRADELAQAMVGMWTDADGNWTGRTDWVLWLAPPLDPADPRMVALAETQLASLDDSLNLVTDGGAYVNKKSLSLARYWANDRGRLAELEPLVNALTADVPTAGTRHVGECWVSLDTDEDGAFDTFDNRTAVPHLWTASLTYLSAMALYRPELFEPLLSDLQGYECSGSGVAQDDDADTCACRVGGHREHRAPLLALVAGALLLAVHRRR